MKSKYFIYNSVLVLGLLLLSQTAMAGILQPVNNQAPPIDDGGQPNQGDDGGSNNGSSNNNFIWEDEYRGLSSGIDLVLQKLYGDVWDVTFQEANEAKNAAWIYRSMFAILGDRAPSNIQQFFRSAESRMGTNEAQQTLRLFIENRNCSNGGCTDEKMRQLRNWLAEARSDFINAQQYLDRAYEVSYPAQAPNPEPNPEPEQGGDSTEPNNLCLIKPWLCTSGDPDDDEPTTGGVGQTDLPAPTNNPSTPTNLPTPGIPNAPGTIGQPVETPNPNDPDDILPTIRAELVQDISTSSQRGSVYLIGATARFEIYPVDPDEEFGLIDEYAAYVDGEEVYRRTSFRGTGKYPPYAFSKHLSSVGSYEIKFSATDNEGNTVFTPTFTLQALNYVDFNCEGTSQGCITVRNMPDRNGSSSNAPMTNTPPLISTTGGSINSPVAVSLLAKLVRQNAALQTQVEQAANQSVSQIQRAQSFAAPTYVIRQKLIRIAGESTNPAHTKEILSIVSELAALEA